MIGVGKGHCILTTFSGVIQLQGPSLVVQVPQSTLMNLVYIIYLRKFSREGCIICNEVFIRMYLPLALEVYNRLFIDSLDFMVVD